VKKAASEANLVEMSLLVEQAEPMMGLAVSLAARYSPRHHNPAQIAAESSM
jgi:hypothetical protein